MCRDEIISYIPTFCRGKYRYIHILERPPFSYQRSLYNPTREDKGHQLFFSSFASVLWVYFLSYLGHQIISGPWKVPCNLNKWEMQYVEDHFQHYVSHLENTYTEVAVKWSNSSGNWKWSTCTRPNVLCAYAFILHYTCMCACSHTDTHTHIHTPLYFHLVWDQSMDKSQKLMIVKA